MKKIKVSEATGKVLDWLVAKALGRLDQRVNPDPRPGVSAVDIGIHEGKVLVFDHNKLDYVPFRPSTDWAQGGPIMDRGHIGISYFSDRAIRPGTPFVIAAVSTDYAKEGSRWKEGPTPLIAAMRCYVVSKLGEEVEVPEELL